METVAENPLWANHDEQAAGAKHACSVQASAMATPMGGLIVTLLEFRTLSMLQSEYVRKPLAVGLRVLGVLAIR